ncbi:hypothetical protein KUTeg_003848 [Tegillarca granosa]|uniref:WSC domain-containing protein n=1 Tax=Tegillarca granosa TaxID=220873 RepID=A0ABQ9FNA5_TEGGR|nr:hypothetical protein KUTeg_003848 [Tegillarca granosa]
MRPKYSGSKCNEKSQNHVSYQGLLEIIMLCYKLYISITVFFTLLGIQDCVHLVRTKQTWDDARKQCIHLGMNLTGSLGFYSNQTVNYDPNKLQNDFTKVDSVASFPAWIGGYVKKTLWISQDDCYSIKHKDLPKIDKSFLLPLNGPKECSLKCGTGTFALQANACFCLTFLNKASLVRKVPITNCVERCSDGSNYYCGALHSTGNHRYLSLYNALYIKETFPDENNCLAMSKNTLNVQAKKCDEKLNCFCRNVHGHIVYQSLSSSWERCNRNCREYRAQVVTIDISYMATLPLQYNVWYWNGYFRFVDHIWDKLETKTTTMTTGVRNRNSTAKEKVNTKLSDKHIFIGIIVGGVVVIVAILITVVCICKRRRGYLFSRTNMVCSCCQSKKKPRPVAPSVRDLDRNRGDPGRHIYDYIDPADITSCPLQNIYEDPDTHFHPKPIVQTDTSGYLEPSHQRNSLNQTLSGIQRCNNVEIHPEARTLLNNTGETEGDIMLNTERNTGLYHVGRPRLDYSSNEYNESRVKETKLSDNAKQDILHQTNRTLSDNSENGNNEINSKETLLSDNG